MRLRIEAALLAWLVACGSPAAALPSDDATAIQTVSREQIQAAATELRRDPNLGSEHTIRSLHWMRGKASPPAAPPPPWIVGFFEYLGQAGSVALWLAGGAGLAIAAVWIYRVARTRAPRLPAVTTMKASHIGGFDIRPASLPEDVGAAARALADAGRTRDALSLLYRGALSRAVHRFGVRIEESYTEAEALRAVQARFDAARIAYFSELICAWQSAVYAGRTAGPLAVAVLCTRFAQFLDAGAA